MIIEERAKTNDERQTDVERCWVELINAPTENIDIARKFLLEDCITSGTSRASEDDNIVYKTLGHNIINFSFLIY